MKQYIADKGLGGVVADGCLTYIQALEQLECPELIVPQSARERNLLNVIARLPVAQPLRSTPMIMDISQSIDRCSFKVDGSVPTMATNAKMWSLRAGRTLSVNEMGKLMGQELCDADLRNTSETQMRHMLGMSIHVATAGFALIGLLASIGGSYQVPPAD